MNLGNSCLTPMDQLPNYQNVALASDLLPNQRVGQGPERNHLKGNISYVSARDRRLAERETQRRDKKVMENQGKQNAYLDSLEEVRSKPSLPGFNSEPKGQNLGGALGRAVGVSAGGDRDYQMNVALSRASEAKSRRDTAYEEKRRRHMAKRQQQQQQQQQQQPQGQPDQMQQQMLMQQQQQQQMQMQIETQQQRQQQGRYSEGENIPPQFRGQHEAEPSADEWKNAKRNAKMGNMVRPSQNAPQPLMVQAAPQDDGEHEAEMTRQRRREILQQQREQRERMAAQQQPQQPQQPNYEKMRKQVSYKQSEGVPLEPATNSSSRRFAPRQS